MPTINAAYQKAHRQYREDIAASCDQAMSDLEGHADVNQAINQHRQRVRFFWLRYQRAVPAWARTELK